MTRLIVDDGVPEVAFVSERELRIGKCRQARDILRQVRRLVSLALILRPRAVPLSVWISCPREICPGCHELIRQMLLLLVQLVGGSLGTAMEIGEDVLDVGSVIREAFKARHFWEVRRRSPIIEFIRIDRYKF